MIVLLIILKVKKNLYSKSGYPHKQDALHNFITELYDIFLLECLPSWSLFYTYRQLHADTVLAL